MAKKSNTKTKASSKDKAAKTAAVKPAKKSKATTKTKTAAIPNGTASKPRKGKATRSGVPQITITLTHDQIAARAYEVWLRNGCINGRDHENWKQAEAELLAELHA